VLSMSDNQTSCKHWLVSELTGVCYPDPQTIYVAGAWYGIVLVPMLQHYFPNSMFELHDIDKTTTKISRRLFDNDDKVTVKNRDCSQLVYEDMLINTSCEHMAPLNIKRGTFCVLQSNNYTALEEHVNCVEGPEQLAEQYELSTVLYQGTLPRSNYDRFMVIGYK